MFVSHNENTIYKQYKHHKTQHCTPFCCKSRKSRSKQQSMRKLNHAGEREKKKKQAGETTILFYKPQTSVTGATSRSVRSTQPLAQFFSAVSHSSKWRRTKLLKKWPNSHKAPWYIARKHASYHVLCVKPTLCAYCTKHFSLYEVACPLFTCSPSETNQDRPSCSETTLYIFFFFSRQQ